MNPDYIDPAVGLPLAGLLWVVVLTPTFARYMRARRRSARRLADDV